MWRSFWLTTKYIFWPLFIKTDVSEFNRICLQILARSVHLKGRFEWVRGSMKSAFAKRAPTIHRKIENTYLRYHLKRSARNEAKNERFEQDRFTFLFHLRKFYFRLTQT